MVETSMPTFKARQRTSAYGMTPTTFSLKELSMKTREAFYAVCILTETGWTVSRFFEKVTAARKWAKWCSATWQAAIYKGGQGGERIADYPKAA
jgi:hypothetical protein